MFRGYVPTKGKKPIEKIKGKNNFYSLEQARELHEYGGILDHDLVMVDVDDKQQAKVLDCIISQKNIKCHKMTTTRGIHFYFVNPGLDKKIKNKIGCILPIGIEADIKLGANNTVVPLKLDGKERDLVQVDQLDILPKWLTPIENPVNFYNMDEGDGRNQSLFNYILTLMSAGFSKDEVKETLKVINEYVLKVPLPKAELEVILRDEAFDKPVFLGEKGKLQVEKFAEYLISEYHIKKIQEQLHIYHEGVYVNTEITINRAMNREIPSIAKRTATEVLWKLEILAEETQLSPPTHIPFKNGLYNVSTRQLEDFRPSYVCKNKIHTSYNPEAYSKDVDEVLQRIACENKHLRALLEEVVGYSLIRENPLGKAFILTGFGSNGKSTFLDMIGKMIGEDNISSLSLQELGQRFKTAELFGKLVNIGDDIPSEFISDTSVFKKVVTGELITIEKKGKDPYSFRNYATLLLSANDVPNMKDTSYGLLRRLVIVPFNAKFKKGTGNFNPFIKKELTNPEALEYLLNLGLQALHRVLDNHEFTKVEEVEMALEEYKVDNNPILLFVQDHKVDNEKTEDVYREYKSWCYGRGEEAISISKLGRELSKLGYKSKPQKMNGATIRVYRKVTESN
ncbi:MAG: phage/plasmid primase, P4 family [Clostridium sp.]